MTTCTCTPPHCPDAARPAAGCGASPQFHICVICVLYMFSYFQKELVYYVFIAMCRPPFWTRQKLVSALQTLAMVRKVEEQRAGLERHARRAGREAMLL